MATERDRQELLGQGSTEGPSNGRSNEGPPYLNRSYGSLSTNPAAGEGNGFRQRSGFWRQGVDEVDDEQNGDREHLIKKTMPKPNGISSVNKNIVRSSYLEYLKIAVLMGFTGLLAFGIFLDGADLLVVSLWPDVPYFLLIAITAVAVSAGHSLGFHGFWHVQACYKIPFRKTGELRCEILVVTISGCLVWGLVLGAFEACYEAPAGLGAMFYMMSGEFLAAASWAIALDLYEQVFSVELTDRKIFDGWIRDHFVVDFLTKLPSSCLLVWLLDLFLEQLDLSQSLDRFLYNFVYTCCLFVSFLLVAGPFRDIVFERLDMVPVPAASTLELEDVTQEP